MTKRTSNKSIKRVAFIGNYEPRQCGIATFTTDLAESIATAYPHTSCIAIPVNDTKEGYDYPSRVRFEINEKEIDSYRRASDFLNINNVDIVCLQFEYGIFGGIAGSHIISLLRDLRMPVVTTFHTILQNPDKNQKLVLEKVASISNRIIVMSQLGKKFLQEIYQIPAEKIDMIHHGIPDVPFVDPNFHKDLFGVEGKTVLLSFGLLSPNKGIENVILALPKILERFPDVVYIVLGETHPQIIRNNGETYRISLQLIAKEIGIESQLIFYDRFVSIDELIQFIGAADIYVTPYLNETQITSGTLAYTLGAGKAVVSTPYWYAKEMLAEGRGALVPFNDPKAMADEVINLLEDSNARHAMRKKAYHFGRDMIWPKVAQRYMESFEKAQSDCMNVNDHKTGILKSQFERLVELPPIKLDHLKMMTDDKGILQHAIYSIPNYKEGYTTDDNTRALIVSVLLENLLNGEATLLSTRYMAFLWNAYDPVRGGFKNLLSYQADWIEESGSDDCQGRAIWSLGIVLGLSINPSLHRIAGYLFEHVLALIPKLTSPRAWAFAIFGIQEYIKRFEGDSRVKHIRIELAERLMSMYEQNRTDEWHWFENSLSYCNAALPQALLICGSTIPNAAMTEVGFESLEWLSNIQRSETNGGHFTPIGSNGFYHKDGVKNRFDQQPVEAQSMISAYLEAYKISRDKKWLKEALHTFEWFLGRNDLSLSLYDPLTGGCRDGLHSDRTNENQGAESTLAFLQSILELRLIDNLFLLK